MVSFGRGQASQISLPRRVWVHDKNLRSCLGQKVDSPSLKSRSESNAIELARCPPRPSPPSEGGEADCRKEPSMNLNVVGLEYLRHA